MHGSVLHANVEVIKSCGSWKKPNFVWTRKHFAACFHAQSPAWWCCRGMAAWLGNNKEKHKALDFLTYFFASRKNSYRAWLGFMTCCGYCILIKNWLWQSKIFSNKHNDPQLPSVPTLTFAIHYQQHVGDAENDLHKSCRICSTEFLTTKWKHFEKSI